MGEWVPLLGRAVGCWPVGRFQCGCPNNYEYLRRHTIRDTNAINAPLYLVMGHIVLPLYLRPLPGGMGLAVSHW